MNGARMIKSGLTRIGVWCALVGVTVLLTVLFNILGNLSVAVVTGVVLGSRGGLRWGAVPISLVFPAVILVLSHSFRIELPPGKVNMIALLCGGAFWGVYAMAFCLRALEQKQEAPAARARRRADVPGSTLGTEISTAGGFSLAALSGLWNCEDAAPDGSPQQRTLRIEDGRFVLSVGDSAGRQREIARGELQLRSPTVGQSAATLIDSKNHPSQLSPERSVPPASASRPC